MLRAAILNEISTLLNISTTDITLMTPKHSKFGDYSLNIQSLPPHDTSPEEVREALSKSPLFEKVDVVGTFINFFISQSELMKHVNTAIAEGPSYGKVTRPNPPKIMLEYGTPNTHKLPHIGHLFSYVYGESLSRILEWSGNEIFRENYQGDVGLHVAKCLYSVLQKKDSFPADATLDVYKRQNSSRFWKYYP